MNAVFEPVAPIGRLLWNRRCLLPLIGLAGMGAILGAAAAVLRLAIEEGPAEASAVAPLAAAVALVLLPAVLGVLAGDALQQLARRPALRLLPALRPKLQLAMGLVGTGTCLLVAVAAASWRPEVGPLTAVGPAALGFALGALSPGRTGSARVWVGALALPVVAEPLCRLAAHPFAAAAMIAGAAAVLVRETARVLRPGAELARAVTWLAPFASAETRRVERQRSERLARRGSGSVAPPERIADLAGWRAADRFERRSASGPLTPLGGARAYFVCLAVASLAPLLHGLTEGPRDVGAVVAVLAEATLGPGESPPRLERSASSTAVMIFWAFPALVAALASVPLLGDLLYPLSRRQRADLARSIGLASALRALATALAVGGLLGLASLAWLGGRWPSHLPPFAWAAFVGLASVPWVQALVLALGRRVRGGTSLAAWSYFLLGAWLPLLAVRGLWVGWTEVAERRLSAPIVAGYLAALAIGYAAHRPLLRREYARRDLIG